MQSQIRKFSMKSFLDITAFAVDIFCGHLKALFFRMQDWYLIPNGSPHPYENFSHLPTTMIRIFRRYLQGIA
jgi:hypothetical protein